MRILFNSIRLLNNDANPNSTCKYNHISACHMAALLDNDSLSLLIKAKAQSIRVDSFGRTPLHLAAWAGTPKQIAILLGLPEDLQNRIIHDMSPETESEIRKVTAGKYDLINMHCTDQTESELPEEWQDSMEHNCMRTKNLPLLQVGWTALHFASSRAQHTCVRLLLAAGADPCVVDAAGRAPLDVLGIAYYSGYSINVHNFRTIIKLFVAVGEKINNSVGNVDTPLHTAVELQSEEAIEDLLNIGASANCLSGRGLTPLHICVQKRLTEHLMILSNFEYTNQDPNVTIVDVKDVNGLTVLNAAVRSKWVQGVRIALGAGANVCIQADDGDAPIHSAAAMGKTVIIQIILTVAKRAIDLQNQNGKTALFISVIHNHIEIVKLLFKNGASVRLNAPFNINVLHVAARHGHVEILKLLLDCICDIKSLINDISKVDLYSPIMYAVVNNYPTCVEMLLQKGAEINIEVPFKHPGTNEEIWTTPLHIVASKNYYEIAVIMLKFHNEIINNCNSIGLQPLHEACMYGNRDIISLFINKGADLSAKHNKMKTPIQLLMDHLPNPSTYLEEIFDLSITSQNGFQEGKCPITINYKVLLPNYPDVKQTKVINALLKTGNLNAQKNLLQHPLIESFVYLKWRSLLPIFYTILAIYGLFGISLNVYIVSVFYYEDKNNLAIINTTNYQDKIYPNRPVPCYLRSNVWKYIMYVTVTLITLLEIFFIKLRTQAYFQYLETWVKFSVIGLSIFLPSFVSWRDPESLVPSPHTPEWVRLMATIAVILTWVKMMFILSRFLSWGYYGLMLGKVTKKVFKVMLTFGVIICGFSLCFLIQFRANPPFEGPWAALTKTLVMMTSEFDYTTMINKQNALEIDASLIILRIMFITFVFFAAIVLMNLMVGVAVNDVHNLEKVGNRIRLMKQVEFLTSLEDVVYHRVVRNMLPKRYNETSFMWNKVTDKIDLKPGDATCFYSKILPKHVKEALYEKAQYQLKQRINEQAYKKQLDEIQQAIAKQDGRIELLHKELYSIKQLLTKSHSDC